MGSHHFLTGISDTRKLIKAGFQILDKIYRLGFEYKKSGVILSDLRNKDYNQLSLFERGDSISDEKLMQVIDHVNNCEGKGTIKSAACGVNNKWWMARNYKSPCYTTRWSDILKVK